MNSFFILLQVVGLVCYAVGLMESSEICNYEMNMSGQAFPPSSDVFSFVCFNHVLIINLEVNPCCFAVKICCCRVSLLNVKASDLLQKFARVA